MTCGFNQMGLYLQKELGVTWDVDLYGELLKIGGGKERYTFCAIFCCHFPLFHSLIIDSGRTFTVLLSYYT